MQKLMGSVAKLQFDNISGNSQLTTNKHKWINALDDSKANSI